MDQETSRCETQIRRLGLKTPGNMVHFDTALVRLLEIRIAADRKTITRSGIDPAYETPEGEYAMSQTATCELVYSSSLDDLSDAVTSRMVDGWWPLGRPFTRGEHFIQAMVFEPRFEEGQGKADEN